MTFLQHNFYDDVAKEVEEEYYFSYSVPTPIRLWGILVYQYFPMVRLPISLLIPMHFYEMAIGTILTFLPFFNLFN
jgi:hypothetical protein